MNIYMAKIGNLLREQRKEAVRARDFYTDGYKKKPKKLRISDATAAQMRRAWGLLALQADEKEHDLRARFKARS